MRALFSRDTLRRHWSGLLWLFPALVVEIVYDARRHVERVRVPHEPGGRLYEYHLTALTSFLGHSLFWLFWGGIAAYLLQAIWQSKDGPLWFWAKLLFLPLWFIMQIFLFFHSE